MGSTGRAAVFPRTAPESSQPGPFLSEARTSSVGSPGRPGAFACWARNAGSVVDALLGRSVVGCPPEHSVGDHRSGDRAGQRAPAWSGATTPVRGASGGRSAFRCRCCSAPCRPGRRPGRGHDAGGYRHRFGAFRVDVTPEAGRTLLLVLRATDGPGWEDPGAVYVSGARTPSAGPPRPGAFASVEVTSAPLLAFLRVSMARCSSAGTRHRPETRLVTTCWSGLRPRGLGTHLAVARLDGDAVAGGAGQSGVARLGHDGGHGGVNAPGRVLAAFLGQPGAAASSRSTSRSRRGGPAASPRYG